MSDATTYEPLTIQFSAVIEGRDEGVARLDVSVQALGGIVDDNERRAAVEYLYARFVRDAR